METYKELKQRHQEEFNKIPLMFAFSSEQFEEGMGKWRLTTDDTDKIYKIPGGGYIQKKDSHLLSDIVKRHARELEDAINADETGDGFIYQMFKYELANHEFGYTWDLEYTLDAIGMTLEEINVTPKLNYALNKAVDEFRDKEE